MRWWDPALRLDRHRAQGGALRGGVRRYLGTPHAVAVGSCTAALHLSLIALGVKPGDEVIVPSMTFVATANVVVHVGATPVLVDCDRASQ